MNNRVKDIAKGLVPPIIWRAGAFLCRDIFARETEVVERGGERDGRWYNEMYATNAKYSKHYTTSHYYFIWSVIADRLTRSGCRSVLDIGCGPGQFASLMRDKGLPRYCGIDLSEKAIQSAKSLCAAYTFLNVNVFETDVFETLAYDVVTSLEFLEHVNDDVAVLRRIPQGKRFIGSVPNFADPSHVRFFLNCDAVRSRYGDLFSSFSVEAFPGDERGTYVWFLCDGVRL
jgi:SAM-dependent methyltransferase